MLEGLAQVYQDDGRRLSITRFEDLAYDLSGLIEIGPPTKVRPAQMSTPMLLRADEEAQALSQASRATLISEAHERFGNALNGLIAPLVGFAALLLGGFSRFGIWRQILGAIVALIIIQMLTRLGQDFVQGDASLWPLAYLGPASGAALAILLLFLAARPGLLCKRWRSPLDAEVPT